MKKIFLDTNVILDAILDREGANNARQILQFGEENQIRNCTSVLSFANISYILHKYLNSKESYEVLQAMFDCMTVLPMGDQLVYDSLLKKGPDFEDTLQTFCAMHSNCDCIITSDRKHFRGIPVPVYTPEEFINEVTD